MKKVYCVIIQRHDESVTCAKWDLKDFDVFDTLSGVKSFINNFLLKEETLYSDFVKLSNLIDKQEFFSLVSRKFHISMKVRYFQN